MSVVKELGERSIIELIHEIIGNYWSKPIYDDSVFYKIDKDLYLVLHTDVANYYSDYIDMMGYYNFGWKIVIANLSDIACKGAKPIGMLLAISLPENFSIDDLKQLIKGACDAMNENGAIYMGGDLSSSKEFSVAGFAFGTANKIVERRGARTGDLIGVTGKFGLNSLGFKAIFENLDLNSSLKDKALDRIFRPKGRIKEAIAISPFITSCMDISDGLAISLNQLAEANGMSFIINEIPIDGEVLEFCKERNLDPLELALYRGGEEYEILFTFPERNLKDIERILEGHNCDFSVIGKTYEGRGIRYIDENRNFEITSLGWEHFKYWK